MTAARFEAAPDSLDPTDWESVRQMGHRMVDDMVNMLAGLREAPTWQPLPQDARHALRSGELPAGPTDLAEVYREFQTLIQPYGSGNAHPRFMGWVQGGATRWACSPSCWRQPPTPTLAGATTRRLRWSAR